MVTGGFGYVFYGGGYEREGERGGGFCSGGELCVEKKKTGQKATAGRGKLAYVWTDYVTKLQFVGRAFALRHF